jgi:HJR/Mrr/RecB family endonuclease
MYKVGFRGDTWVLVTDGNDIYCAAEDLRYYSQPPELVRWRGTTGNALDDALNAVSQPHKLATSQSAVRPEPAGNRISKLLISQAELEHHCRANRIWLSGRLPIIEASRNLYFPAIAGGAIGAYVNGFLGASIGAGVCSLIAYAYSSAENEFSKIFARAKQNYSAWSDYESAQVKLDQENLVRYRQVALDRWNRYHRLRNIASVDALSGVEFEVAIANLYERKGYQVTMTKASGDFGVDVLATKDSELLAIQVKRYSGNVGVAAVQEVAAGARYYKASITAVVTNSFFTEQAKVLARTLRVKLIDKKGLVEMWDGAHTATYPEFSMQRYEALKCDIGKELYQLESASGGKPKKRFAAKRKS